MRVLIRGDLSRNECAPCGWAAWRASNLLDSLTDQTYAGETPQVPEGLHIAIGAMQTFCGLTRSEADRIDALVDQGNFAEARKQTKETLSQLAEDANYKMAYAPDRRFNDLPSLKVLNEATSGPARALEKVLRVLTPDQNSAVCSALRSADDGAWAELSSAVSNRDTRRADDLVEEIKFDEKGLNICNIMNVKSGPRPSGVG